MFSSDYQRGNLPQAVGRDLRYELPMIVRDMHCRKVSWDYARYPRTDSDFAAAFFATLIPLAGCSNLLNIRNPAALL